MFLKLEAKGDMRRVSQTKWEMHSSLPLMCFESIQKITSEQCKAIYLQMQRIMQTGYVSAEKINQNNGET